MRGVFTTQNWPGNHNFSAAVARAFKNDSYAKEMHKNPNVFKVSRK